MIAPCEKPISVVWMGPTPVSCCRSDAGVPDPNAFLERRHRCGNAFRPVGLGHTLHRKPLPPLTDVRAVRRTNADDPRIGPLRRKRPTQRSKVLGAGPHAVEKQQQLSVVQRRRALQNQIGVHGASRVQ